MRLMPGELGQWELNSAFQLARRADLQAANP